jgi:hypothetical protein
MGIFIVNKCRVTPEKTGAPNRLSNEEQSVEHDRFREGDRKNRLHQNRGGRTGIATDGGGSAHADQSHANRRAEGGEADVNASANLCQ